MWWVERERNNGNNGVDIDLVYGILSQEKKINWDCAALWYRLASVKKNMSKFCFIGKYFPKTTMTPGG